MLPRKLDVSRLKRVYFSSCLIVGVSVVLGVQSVKRVFSTLDGGFRGACHAWRFPSAGGWV